MLPVDIARSLPDGQVAKARKCTMPKTELTFTAEQKALLQRAADQRHLKLATWAKAHLLAKAIEITKGQNNE
jgi:hypothetical protein